MGVVLTDWKSINDVKEESAGEVIEVSRIRNRTGGLERDTSLTSGNIGTILRRGVGIQMLSKCSI